ncbi:MAG TPA: membrane protein insertase YidC, partial [Steroidobacteraceae bacterium]|nr:membrane protein insertase YidC [Steroidobacteraceae bacterium]
GGATTEQAPARGKESSGLDAAIPQASSGSASAPDAGVPATATPAPASQPEATVAATPRTVRVRTDVLDLDIGLAGGELQRADLLKYPKVKGQSEPVRLLNRDAPETLYVLQSGLTGPAGSERPTHLATFTSPQTEYSLGNADELRVPLTWRNDQGVTVTKTFVFRRGQYDIDLEYDVKNAGQQPWQAAAYAQVLRSDPKADYSMFNVESYAFRGPAIWDGERYRKLDIEDKDDRQLALEVNNGWIAALQHHFVGAVVPPKDVTHRVTLGAEGREYVLATAGPLRTVAPGGAEKFRYRLFVGPKLQEQLAATGPELERVADYGRLTMLAKPLFLVLDKIHDVIGNWGLAIIIVTLLLKLAFYPLSEASGRSMAKMKTLAPRIKNLQETYKDDREKLGRAMMELYQREKINPVAGCLPIVVQIPVFLAFYWVLLESVEMRQAPFMGWINDLSSRDPFFILPAIMAGAMFVQYKLNPQPPDPVQQKVFMIMPIAMSVMFAFFPAGLVLYWVTNTVLSIAQQWNINRRIERAAAAKRS